MIHSDLSEPSKDGGDLIMTGIPVSSTGTLQGVPPAAVDSGAILNNTCKVREIRSPLGIN